MRLTFACCFQYGFLRHAVHCSLAAMFVARLQYLSLRFGVSMQVSHKVTILIFVTNKCFDRRHRFRFFYIILSFGQIDPLVLAHFWPHVNAIWFFLCFANRSYTFIICSNGQSPNGSQQTCALIKCHKVSTIYLLHHKQAPLQTVYRNCWRQIAHILMMNAKTMCMCVFSFLVLSHSHRSSLK